MSIIYSIHWPEYNTIYIGQHSCNASRSFKVGWQDTRGYLYGCCGYAGSGKGLQRWRWEHPDAKSIMTVLHQVGVRLDYGYTSRVDEDPNTVEKDYMAMAFWSPLKVLNMVNVGGTFSDSFVPQSLLPLPNTGTWEPTLLKRGNQNGMLCGRVANIPTLDNWVHLWAPDFNRYKLKYPLLFDEKLLTNATTVGKWFQTYATLRAGDM